MAVNIKKRGVYVRDMKAGPNDEAIHNPVLEAGDIRFAESEAGRAAIQRLVTQYGVSEAEAKSMIS